jgi:hypothetical protein
MKDLLRAPWSDQPLRCGVRLLAWVFVACGTWAIGLVIYFAVVQGAPKGTPMKFYALLIGVAYMTALALSSALHGKAPHGWLPWQTKKPPAPEREESRS